MRAEWIVYWPCLSKVKPSTDPIATNYDSGELEKRASRIRIQDEFICLFSSTCDSIWKMKLPNLFKSFQIIQMNLPIPNPKRLGALKPCRCCQRWEWLDLNQNWKWASNHSHHANRCVLIYDGNYSFIIYHLSNGHHNSWMMNSLLSNNDDNNNQRNNDSNHEWCMFYWETKCWTIDDDNWNHNQNQ